MDKKVVVGGILLLVVLGGGGYLLSQRSSGTEKQASGDVSESGTVTKSEERTAEAFVTKLERHMQRRDFADVYDLICSQDRVSVNKTDYVKTLTNFWGSIQITSFEIKSVLEEESGVTVQIVENTTDGKSETQLIPLEKPNGEWCFRSNITGTISQVKEFKNISLKIGKINRPYIVSYSTPSEGMERVRIAVSVTNDGKKELVCHALDGGETRCGAFFFYLKDRAGAVYTASFYGDVKMPEFTLAPKSTVSGTVGFEIPVDSTGYTLVFRDLGLATGIAEVPAGF